MNSFELQIDDLVKHMPLTNKSKMSFIDVNKVNDVIETILELYNNNKTAEYILKFTYHEQTLLNNLMINKEQNTFSITAKEFFYLETPLYCYTKLNFFAETYHALYDKINKKQIHAHQQLQSFNLIFEEKDMHLSFNIDEGYQNDNLNITFYNNEYFQKISNNVLYNGKIKSIFNNDKKDSFYDYIVSISSKKISEEEIVFNISLKNCQFKNILLKDGCIFSYKISDLFPKRNEYHSINVNSIDDINKHLKDFLEIETLSTDIDYKDKIFFLDQAKIVQFIKETTSTIKEPDKEKIKYFLNVLKEEIKNSTLHNNEIKIKKEENININYNDSKSINLTTKNISFAPITHFNHEKLYTIYNLFKDNNYIDIKQFIEENKKNESKAKL